MPVDVMLGALFTVPCVLLGSIALIRAERKDIPEIMRWLSRWGRR